MSISVPKGWTLATISDLIAPQGLFVDGDWVESKDQDPDGEVRLIQLADVGDGAFRDRSSRFLRPDQAERLGCTFLREGDVLVARMPDPLGRACLYPGGKLPAVTAVDVCIIRPANEEVDTRWLMWFLNAPQFRREVAAHQAGTTRKRISRKNLGSLLLPVPPVAEQHHIVAAIDEHFSHLDAGLAALAGASRNLQRLRTALLRDALVGEPLPLGAVTQFVRGVTYKKADASSLPGPNLVPVLRATNIQDGLTLHSDLVFVPRRCVADVQLLRPGDIVIAMSSGSSSVVGKSALLRSSWAGSFGAFCGVLRSLAGVDPVYLAHVLASREVRNRWSASAKGSNINNLKITDIASTMVPVPSLAEQRAIAATIDEPSICTAECCLQRSTCGLRGERPFH
jgi:type I restriction enzyme S subunit